jgi:D-lactate dehydrogenase
LPVLTCFETEEWEQALLADKLGGVCGLQFFKEPIGEAVIGCAETEILSVFIYSRLSGDVLSRFPKLRLIATRSTGFDHIDVAWCRAHGVRIANVPFYGENTVAEHTFALILALSRNIHKAYVRTTRTDFSLEGLQGFDLKEKTLGVVGAGHIGLHVIRMAKGFGMRVLAMDVRRSPFLEEVLGFQHVPFEQLLAESDIISLHVPYMPSTHHLINRDALGRVKRGALLINTSRGGLVDTDALVWALDEGILGGAGLDVLEGEELIKEERQLLSREFPEETLKTLLKNHILLHRENVVITPHIAFNSREAVGRILETTVRNIRAFLEGLVENLVVGEAAA